MEVQITTINYTPMFVITNNDSIWCRVYGATFDRRGNRWLFPAYAPFLSYVLYDIPKVCPDATFHPDARRWCDEYPSLEENRARVAATAFPTKSYTHQLDGVAELLTNYRWGLRWGMGVGKTKIVIDTLALLGCKALILCPLAAVDNWAKEVEVHSGGKLTAISFKAPTKKQKLELLTRLGDADVIITTYDTAKRYGIPCIFPETSALFSSVGTKTLSTQMRRLFSRVNSREIQADLARDWLRDVKKPRQIKEEIDTLTVGKIQWLSQIPYRMIVADESHRIADRKSIRTQVCTELSRYASRRVLLSGTMVGGNPWHLYPQLKFLAPYLTPEDSRAFEDKYFIKSPNDDRIIVGYRKIHILNQRVASVTSERHLDDCVDLPNRRVETLTFELTKAQKRDYNYIVKTSTLVLPDDSALSIANGAVRNSKLLQICSGFIYIPADKHACDTCEYLHVCVAENVKVGSPRCGTRANMPKAQRKVLRFPTNPKLDLLTEKLEDVVAVSKVIIWASLTEELTLIGEMLTKNKWGYVRVDGSTTGQMRRWEDQFVQDDTCRVYLAQITTGIAVTLNSARYMFYFSRNFSPDDRNQSMDRNYRIGQTKKTVVYDLCANRSIELQQLQALSNKDEISALLTNKVECNLCNQYSVCRTDGINPWEKRCVLSTEKERVIMKARTI